MTVEIHNHCQLLVVHQITVMFKIRKNVHFNPLKSFVLVEVSDIRGKNYLTMRCSNLLKNVSLDF